MSAYLQILLQKSNNFSATLHTLSFHGVFETNWPFTVQFITHRFLSSQEKNDFSLLFKAVFHHSSLFPIYLNNHVLEQFHKFNQMRKYLLSANISFFSIFNQINSLSHLVKATLRLLLIIHSIFWFSEHFPFERASSGSCLILPYISHFTYTKGVEWN